MTLLHTESPSRVHRAAVARESESPLDALIRDEELREVRRVTAQLDDREWTILFDRFMGMTLEQCGGIHGFTRERARQIQADAINRIQSLLGIAAPLEPIPLELSSDSAIRAKVSLAQHAGLMEIKTFPNEPKAPRGKRNRKVRYVSLRKRLKKLAA